MNECWTYRTWSWRQLRQSRLEWDRPCQVWSSWKNVLQQRHYERDRCTPWTIGLLSKTARSCSQQTRSRTWLKKRKQKKEERGNGKKGGEGVVGGGWRMFVLVMNPKELKVNRNLTFLKRSWGNRNRWRSWRERLGRTGTWLRWEWWWWRVVKFLFRKYYS